MPWVQCESCWHWFDDKGRPDDVWIIYKGYKIGVGCPTCKNKILNREVA